MIRTTQPHLSPQFNNDRNTTMLYSRVLYPVLTASLAVSVYTYHQKPIMAEPNLGPAIPGHSQDPATSEPPRGGSVILSDILGRDRSINIFAGFTRDIETVDERLRNEDLNTTILAPINSAIMALPRKPWEDPREYAVLGTNAYEGEDGEQRAHKNLRKFVEAHVVTSSPWVEGEKVETMGGDRVWWEEKNGVKVIQPGNIEVSSVGGQVANGEVWIIKGPRNYA